MRKRIIIIVVILFCFLLIYEAASFINNRYHSSDTNSLEDESIEPMAFEWPQFHGPNRDNYSIETGLLKSWPKNGPELIWQCDGIGKGWSSPTIAAGRIYITGVEDDKEFLSCFNLAGKLKWKLAYGTASKMYCGTRSSPTIDGNYVYVISGTGELVCIDTNEQMIEWKINGYRLFEGDTHHFGTAESPLIFEDKIFYTPCGKRTTMAALDKRTGEIIWESESLDDTSAYVSPIIFEYAAMNIIVTITGHYVIALDSATGEFLWKYPYVENHKTKEKDNTLIQNAVMPLYHDGQLYITSGYDHVGIALKLSEDAKQVTLAWEDKTLDCHHGGVVLHDGYIYGSNWKNNLNGNWVCINWLTGQVMYEHQWICKGSILYADEMLYCYEEKEGHVALVKASPQGFEIVSSFKIKQGDDQYWAHPVICEGRLYIRSDDYLMAYDIKDKNKN